jgi:tungstate transport system substrate-binding protein
MYNDFVLVGPPADPAGIAGDTDAAAAFSAIASDEHAFISRGDDSGTHKKEMSIWGAAGVQAVGPWYLSVGQGMGDVLTMASEVEAYTLADRGTYLAMRERLQLDVLVEGDERLFNPYGVIVVTDASNLEGARAFAAWIVSAEGRRSSGPLVWIPTANRCSCPNAE